MASLQPTANDFVRLVAGLDKDGEKVGGTGDIFEMSPEDACNTLHNLIDMARTISKTI